MSWVTDVILLFYLSELYNDEDESLEEHGWGILDNFGQHVHSDGKAMQACLYGGAFNFLKVDEFIEVVKAQA